jgi:hypothetical protein
MGSLSLPPPLARSSKTPPGFGFIQDSRLAERILLPVMADADAGVSDSYIHHHLASQTPWIVSSICHPDL